MTSDDPTYFDWLYQQQRRDNLAEQKPSIGRIVIYRGSQSNGTNEHPAIINRVWNDDMVNLCIFPDCGQVGVQTSIKRIEPESTEPVGWFWPPRV